MEAPMKQYNFAIYNIAIKREMFQGIEITKEKSL